VLRGESHYYRGGNKLLADGSPHCRKNPLPEGGPDSRGKYEKKLRRKRKITGRGGSLQPPRRFFGTNARLQ